MKTIAKRIVHGKDQTNSLRFLGPTLPPHSIDDYLLIQIHILGFQTLSFLANFGRAPV